MRYPRRPPTLVVPSALALTPWRLADREQWSELVRRNETWLRPFAAVAPPGLGQLGRAAADAARDSTSWPAIVRAQERRNRSGEALGWILRVPAAGALALPAEEQRPERWRPAGQLSITAIHRGASMSGTLGYWIDRELAGRGLMTKAVGAAARYALGPGGLHRLEAVIHPANQASIAVVRRCGFREEGLRAGALHTSTGWQDHLVFALTSEELGASMGR
ncbi:GNAT family N-acetyltransferase [Galactobacter caseinivorans]|uniref:N-acetyltransferase n=1 Tax=Galactobacter caseinivorans TaxID=2676123 RepID=A0A496PLZ3_9MICC|nr:GNAT family protein [Galactobacter caseinivorans]RKW71523.1 N-acetyltransferase [Galactobacter caseinivorans]